MFIIRINKSLRIKAINIVIKYKKVRPNKRKLTKKLKGIIEFIKELEDTRPYLNYTLNLLENISSLRMRTVFIKKKVVFLGI